MNWEKRLSELEQNKNWSSAIDLMQETINKNENSIDPYLSMCYLLMNLLVEEQYNSNDHNYYSGLLKKYFLESYSKFCNDPEYLFYIGRIACISEWYFDIELAEAQAMMKKASELIPDNILYQWGNFGNLDIQKPTNRNKVILYARQALLDSMVMEALQSKGSLGEYIRISLDYWSKQDIR